MENNNQSSKSGLKVKKAPKRILWTCVSGVLVASLAAGVYFVTASNSDAPANAQAVNQYMEDTVERGSIVVGLTEAGSAAMIDTALTLGFDAVVEQTFVKAGQYVEAGTLIATVNLDEFEDMVEEAERSLESAELSLQSVALSNESQELNAENTYSKTMLSGENAAATYAIDLQQLQNGYESLLRELEDLEDDRAEIISDLNGGLKDDYNFSELEDELDDAQDEVDDQEDYIDEINAQIDVLQAQEDAADPAYEPDSTPDSNNDSSGGDEGGDSSGDEGDDEGGEGGDSSGMGKPPRYASKGEDDIYQMSLEELIDHLVEAESTLRSLENAVDSARSSLDNADDNYDKAYEDLEEELEAAEEKIEDKLFEIESYEISMQEQQMSLEADYQETMFDYESADDVYDNARSSANNSEATSAIKVDEAQAELDSIIELTTDGNIVAPQDGYIMTLVADGTELAESTTLVTLAERYTINLTVYIPQEDIAQITIGMDANVVFDAYEELTIPATVDSISISPSGGMSSSVNYTVTLTCDITDYPDIVVYEGMTTNVTFIEKQVEDVLLVSNKYIINENAKQYVLVYDSTGMVVQKEITTGFSDGFDVEIIDGLEEGDVVLIESAVSSNAS